MVTKCGNGVGGWCGRVNINANKKKAATPEVDESSSQSWGSCLRGVGLCSTDHNEAKPQAGPGWATQLPQDRWGGPATSKATNCHGCEADGEWGGIGRGVCLCLVDPQGERGAGVSSGARRGQKQWLGLADGEGCLGEILHSTRTQNLLNLHWKVIGNLSEGPGTDCQERGLKRPSGLHNTWNELEGMGWVWEADFLP